MSDRLKAVKPPPTIENGRRRQARRTQQNRAAKAIKILERGQFLSDGQTYGSRPSARDKAVRIIRALVEFQEVPRSHLHIAVRIIPTQKRPGWRWWVWLNESGGDEPQPPATGDYKPAAADRKPARGKARSVPR